MSTSAGPIDVLVVGAGPTGLTLACELLRHGLSCRVIEELAAPVVYSKAAAVQARTMEVFDAMGIIDAFLPHTRTIHGVCIHTREGAEGKRVGHVVLGGVESRFPFVYGASQHDTEKVLTARFEALGGRIERSTKLARFTQDADAVHASAVGPSGDHAITAKWIVGCDGAHSTVRKACGFTFEGGSYEERILQADVVIDFPKPVEDDEIQAFLHPDGPIALFPLFKDGRYRLIAFLLPGSPEIEPTLENFQKLIDERGPSCARVRDPAWMVSFRIHHRMTDGYRKGRAFVAGDAAHIHSPAGGQGMNTGIQDAFNLAWKLALVEKGVAKAAILDSYEAERLPVAKKLLSTTDSATRGLETFASLRHPIAVGLRNQLIGFVTKLDLMRERAGNTLSMIEVSYRDSPIVAQDRVPITKANILSSDSSEHPSLADWAAFGDGPAPGDRAADLALPDGRRVFDLFRTGNHVALLFDGAASTEAGYRNLEQIARALAARDIDVHVIVPHAQKPAALAWDGALVLDGEGALHKRYGARSECLYLVRPDGHVAYRSQPASREALERYLGTVFT